MNKIFIEQVPISKISLWDKNFRDISAEAFARLKNKIKELGIFKLKRYAEYTGNTGDIFLIDGKGQKKAFEAVFKVA